MKYIIDRIEEDKAVLECKTGEMLTVPAKLLENAKEGDTIILSIEQKRTDTNSIFERLRKKSKPDT